MKIYPNPLTKILISPEADIVTAFAQVDTLGSVHDISAWLEFPFGVVFAGLDGVGLASHMRVVEAASHNALVHPVFPG